MGRPRPAVIVEIIPVEDAPMRSPSDPDASGRGARLDGSGTWGGSGGSPDAGSGTSRGGGGPTPDGRDDRRCGPARMALVGAGAVVSLIAVVALVTGGANDHRDAAPAPPVPTTA
ncbi:MAG: hypothetical protein JWM12_4023, partial [Ilumatobacteraceae bacterium]|nr:hypothetical protein [Ilumatobacteraceae bacterium]